MDRSYTCYYAQMWTLCTCTNESNNIFMMHLPAFRNTKVKLAKDFLVRERWMAQLNEKVRNGFDL